MLSLVLAVDLVPFDRVLRNVVFLLPVGDVPRDEYLPELSVFAFDLRGAELDLVELFGRVYALQDGFYFPVFEVANIVKVYKDLAVVSPMERY